MTVEALVSDHVHAGRPVAKGERFDVSPAAAERLVAADRVRIVRDEPKPDAGELATEQLPVDEEPADEAR